MSSLLTSAEAASLLGVSVSTLKRWADAGHVEFSVTAGHHRRFTEAAVKRLRSVLGTPSGEPPPPPTPTPTPTTSPADRDGRLTVAELLDQTVSTSTLVGVLLADRDLTGSWWQVAARVGETLTELGLWWARGEISILEEHLASERLARALARVCEWLPGPAAAADALLATVEGEEHTLGLSLVELCLRARGWRTDWAGRRTPVDEVLARVSARPPRLLALSASSLARDPRPLAHQVALLGTACARTGTLLVVGGDGAWPEAPRHAHRCRDLGAFDRLLATLELARTPSL